MITMRLLGSMELWLANTFLPLLLLIWLPVGTASQMVKPVATVQLEITLENLTVQKKWYNLECLERENQTNLVFLGENFMNFTSSNLCTDHTGICVSGVFIIRTNSADARNQTNTVFLDKNCMNFTSSSLCTACTAICECRLFITRPNSADTGNSTQAADPSCGSPGSQTDVTKKIWTGLNLLLCILLGLAVGTLLYMPVIGFLLWQRRRNRTGELMSGEVAEGNQVNTAAPVTGTEDLTYANLNFEKKGTASASSNVIYTEIKPLQQKQSDGDGSAASTEDGALRDDGSGFFKSSESNSSSESFRDSTGEELSQMMATRWPGATPYSPISAAANVAGAGGERGRHLARPVKSPNCIKSNTTSPRCFEEAEDPVWMVGGGFLISTSHTFNSP
ncbi:hypothetical protein DV515_00008111 [Chloebia gouldiae]|uniref:Uncharacterized protein n=1 Tax=Chloebia gouldiae TaxID=44316 RepID=A0A3L8SFA8_CHLGU|nr:hypothetical protein DV515_00008111 [Chloebia gouldiae]